jgi:hypothetical protein
MSSRYPTTGKVSRRPKRKVVRKALPKARLSAPLMPSKMRRILRYNTQLTLTAPSTATITNYQFRLNSLYDPDLTSTGHQPMGYDQLTALYNQWVVTRCRVMVNGIMLSDPAYTAGSAGILAMYGVANDSSVPTTPSQLIENHQPSYSTVSGFQNYARLSRVFDLPRMFGLTQTQYTADDTFYGQISANPSKNAYLNLAYFTLGLPNCLSATFRVDVTIEFEAYFKQAFTLTSS